MTKISQLSAENVANRACDDRFADEIKREEERESALATECWESVFTKEEKEAALSMPDGWLRRDPCLRFNAGGWSIILRHPLGLPVPSNEAFCRVLGALPDALAAKAREFVKEREIADGRRRQTRRDLTTAIKSAGTWKKLLSSWPEGKEFYDGYLRRENSTAVAVPFAQFNSTLGLALASAGAEVGGAVTEAGQ